MQVRSEKRGPFDVDVQVTGGEAFEGPAEPAGFVPEWDTQRPLALEEARSERVEDTARPLGVRIHNQCDGAAAGKDADENKDGQ